MTDYEIEYQRNTEACGKPFPEMVAFFEGLNDRCVSVLDLGCGQGRDAIMIARLGHRVHGIDAAPTGVSQMQKVAEREQLMISAEVADIRNYEPAEKYDVVVLDRVIHMLSDDADKVRVLRSAAASLAAGGYVLVVETPRNLPTVERCFEGRSGWQVVLRKKGFRFYRKVDRPAAPAWKERNSAPARNQRR